MTDKKDKKNIANNMLHLTKTLQEKDIDEIIAYPNKEIKGFIKSTTVFLTLRGSNNDILDNEKEIIIDMVKTIPCKAYLITEEQNKKDCGFHFHIIFFYGSQRGTVLSAENKIRKQIATTKLKYKYNDENAILTRYITANRKEAIRPKEILISYCTKDFLNIDEAIATQKLIIHDPDNLIFTKEKILTAKAKYPFQQEKTSKADKHIFIEEFLKINKISLDFEDKRFIRNNQTVMEDFKINELLMMFIRNKNLYSLNLEDIFRSIFTLHKLRYELYAYRPEQIFITDNAIIDIDSRKIIERNSNDLKPIKYLCSEPNPYPDEDLMEFFLFNIGDKNIDNIMKVFYPDLYNNYKKAFEEYQKLGRKIEREDLLDETPSIEITKTTKIKYEKMNDFVKGESLNEENIYLRNQNLNEIITPVTIETGEKVIRDFNSIREEYQKTFLNLYKVSEIIEITKDNQTIHINTDKKKSQFQQLRSFAKNFRKRLYLVGDLLMTNEHVSFYLQELISINKKILQVRNKIHEHYNNEQKLLWIHSNCELTRKIFLDIIHNFININYITYENMPIQKTKKIIWKEAKTEKIIPYINNFIENDNNHIFSSDEDLSIKLEHACEENKISLEQKEILMKNLFKICLSDEHENISSMLNDKINSHTISLIKSNPFLDSLISNIIYFKNDERYSFHNMIQLPTLPSSITITA